MEKTFYLWLTLVPCVCQHRKSCSLPHGTFARGRHKCRLRLSDYLHTRDTLLTGAVSAGRGPPEETQDEKLVRYQCVFTRQDNRLVVKWQDKRVKWLLMELSFVLRKRHFACGRPQCHVSVSIEKLVVFLMEHLVEKGRNVVCDCLTIFKPGTFTLLTGVVRDGINSR